MTSHALSPATAHLLRTAGNLVARGGARGRFCILNYHRILEDFDPLLDSEPDVKTFRWHMALLAQCFNVIPLADAVAALGTSRMPPRAVCITFDDGYRSAHELALPILKEFGFPATVFVTTGHFTTGNMWNDNIIDALRFLPNGPLDLSEAGLPVFELGPVAERKEVVDSVVQACKYLPPAGRMQLDRVLENLVGYSSEQRLMLTSDMVVSLSQQGIEIGGHTVTHPILTSIDDGSALEEIVENKKALENILGKPVRLFAYPNGKVNTDFDERHVRMVREAGYSAAFTTAIGAAARQHDRYQFPRSRPWDDDPAKFGARLIYWLAGLGVK
jgi:peptidoglycan/xylan/chitin deacetylase (PgdA/CDA1 family)